MVSELYYIIVPTAARYCMLQHQEVGEAVRANIKLTDLVFYKPIGEVFPCALILTLELPNQDYVAARCLHVQRAIHVGIARTASKLWPGSCLGGANSKTIVDRRR